ncbi:uncharacterized protein NDAI_0H03790 [Naumovozyma dairenensis CBS 421]|uniref:Uncharacterized protein n=1 Tax=Naumovozyma dairenensis (strain ATCC 10597 / BCRC 20456 / CBS 421 / NBRC 0211 / NRRL Y-12639) TaxID=1071378 RepID=G0WFJ1_NAUDC|nr:hypothetical protein NDAI_0H03790 [Naumovozyma dairenensis CBS 421]CCD26552.1 hypothetical protein NDAI_0H03790 [Naumovozyma dairenensis CBS 421]
MKIIKTTILFLTTIAYFATSETSVANTGNEENTRLIPSHERLPRILSPDHHPNRHPLILEDMDFQMKRGSSGGRSSGGRASSGSSSSGSSKGGSSKGGSDSSSVYSGETLVNGGSSGNTGSKGNTGSTSNTGNRGGSAGSSSNTGSRGSSSSNNNNGAVAGAGAGAAAGLALGSTSHGRINSHNNSTSGAQKNGAGVIKFGPQKSITLLILMATWLLNYVM